jgi:hypothetical protein
MRLFERILRENSLDDLRERFERPELYDENDMEHIRHIKRFVQDWDGAIEDHTARAHDMWPSVLLDVALYDKGDFTDKFNVEVRHEHHEHGSPNDVYFVVLSRDKRGVNKSGDIRQVGFQSWGDAREAVSEIFEDEFQLTLKAE